ncbi:hypothetical protein [Nocardia carnea]|nr:hypothetical protein [Nocardia carnea]
MSLGMPVALVAVPDTATDHRGVSMRRRTVHHRDARAERLP